MLQKSQVDTGASVQPVVSTSSEPLLEDVDTMVYMLTHQWTHVTMLKQN